MKLTSRSWLALTLMIPFLILFAGCGGGKGGDVVEPAHVLNEDTGGAETATPSERDTDDNDRPDTTVNDRWNSGGFENEDPNSENILDRKTADDYMNQRVLKNIYFALDRHELNEEALKTLKDNSNWLKAHDEFAIVVEGHCDERGSIEYNLALGERRANAVRDYLTSLGIEHERMRLVSYGEERPIAEGSSESAWSQNRRAAFIIEER